LSISTQIPFLQLPVLVPELAQVRVLVLALELAQVLVRVLALELELEPERVPHKQPSSRLTTMPAGLIIFSFSS
jgi:hypothetical protein